eukprot:3119297-Amphidinium_carterae.1
MASTRDSTTDESSWDSDTGSSICESSEFGRSSPTERDGPLEHKTREGAITVSASTTPEPQRESQQQSWRQRGEKRKTYPADCRKAAWGVDAEGSERVAGDPGPTMGDRVCGEKSIDVSRAQAGDATVCDKCGGSLERE